VDARATDDHPTPADLREWIENVFTQDPFSLRLGIELVEVVRGRSLLRMPVGGPCMNVHGGCHGGAIWTLADLAFGIAGAYDGPIITIGSDLTFFRPAGPGTCLYATGREVTRKGKTGAFQVIVATDIADADSVVATGHFTGRWVRKD
jgi:acyl-CoA thioesterase